MNKARTLFSKVVFIPKLCIEDTGGRGRVMQQARLSSCKLIICKSLGDFHHLLARRPVNILRPFLQRTYFSLKVVGQEPPSKKALDKVAFLQSKGVVAYNKKKNQLKGPRLQTLKLLLTPIILINTLPGTQQVRDMET